MDLVEDQLTIEQVSHGSLRSTNQYNLRMKWFTSLEHMSLVRSLLVSQLGKKHPVTQNIEYSQGTWLICMFSIGLCIKCTSQWKRAVNGPGLWLIGLSSMYTGYSSVLFSWIFVIGRIKTSSIRHGRW